MEISLILGIAGFAVTFVLLFVFSAKYKDAVLAENTAFGEAQGSLPAGSPQGSLTDLLKKAGLNNVNNNLLLELADLKETVNQLHYRLEELRLVSETKNTDLNKTIAKVDQRLNTFEKEYMEHLQPALNGLIEELENLRPDSSQIKSE